MLSIKKEPFKATTNEKQRSNVITQHALRWRLLKSRNSNRTNVYISTDELNEGGGSFSVYVIGRNVKCIHSSIG